MCGRERAFLSTYNTTSTGKIERENGGDTAKVYASACVRGLVVSTNWRLQVVKQAVVGELLVVVVLARVLSLLNLALNKANVAVVHSSSGKRASKLCAAVFVKNDSGNITNGVVPCCGAYYVHTEAPTLARRSVYNKVNACALCFNQW